jgi:hypothetical protein
MQGHEGCHLLPTSFNYRCEEKLRKTAWKVLYLSYSYGQKNKVDMLPVLKTGIQKTLNQDHANNM